jgi:hypothetical protein
MKTLLLTLTTLSLAFFIGCRENSITDPGVNESVNKDQAVTPDKNFQGTIPLEGLLDDPHPVINSFYRITGQIEYSFRIYYADPIPPAPQQYLSVRFETNADLQYVCTIYPPSFEDQLTGFIAEVSEDFIPLSGSHSLQIEKTYTIQGRKDGMVLKVRLLVTNNKIELNAMWLALPNANSAATEINHY